MKIKIKYSEIRKKSKEELLKMRKQLKLALLHREMQSKKRDKGISPKEIRKNISRINHRLNELK